MTKILSEGLAAWVAIGVSVVGGVVSTAFHYGHTNAQMSALSQQQAKTEARVDKHDEALALIEQQNAALKQSVDDIKDTVHDIQDHVRKSDHDNSAKHGS